MTSAYHTGGPVAQNTSQSARLLRQRAAKLQDFFVVAGAMAQDIEQAGRLRGENAFDSAMGSPIMAPAAWIH